MPSPTPLVPQYTPQKILLPSIGEHTLVTPLGTTAPQAQDEVEELCRSVWSLLHHLERDGQEAMTVLEIAVRMRLSRGVAILAVSELLRQRRARVSRQITGVFDPRVEVRDAWSLSSHCDAKLRSAKVLVMGDPKLGQEFIGSCSTHVPINHRETIYLESSDVFAASITTQMSMGTLPLETTTLHLLGGIEADVHQCAALWADLVRDSCGALVVTNGDDLSEVGIVLEFLTEHRIPAQVALHHAHDGPTPEEVTGHLGLCEEQVTLCDVRSRPSTRAALGDVINQRPTRHA